MFKLTIPATIYSGSHGPTIKYKLTLCCYCCFFGVGAFFCLRYGFHMAVCVGAGGDGRHRFGIWLSKLPGRGRQEASAAVPMAVPGSLSNSVRPGRGATLHDVQQLRGQLLLAEAVVVIATRTNHSLWHAYMLPWFFDLRFCNILFIFFMTYVGAYN